MVRDTRKKLLRLIIFYDDILKKMIIILGVLSDRVVAIKNCIAAV